jgi:hypothetical protein
MAAVLLPLLSSSCVTKPAPAVPPASSNASDHGATAAQSESPEPSPAKAAKAPAETQPEFSFPRRLPYAQDLIVASLHEPALPALARTKAKTEAAPAAAPAAASPATTPTPILPAAAASRPNAAEAAAEGAPKATVTPEAAVEASPKAAAKPTAPAKPASKTEASTAKTSAPAKAAAKIPEPEPKNAASSQALALDPVPEKKNDISRNFSVVEGARFEVPFEGTGWTYLGEKTGKMGVEYDSRRFAGTSLVFILNPVKSGDYILRFQRQDSLRGISWEELVGVTVAAKPVRDVSAGTGATATASVPAPVPPNAAPTMPSGTAVASAASATAAVPSTPAVVPAAAPPASPEAALVLARAELAAGRAQGALNALDRLFALAPAGGPVPGADEAFFLYARALESNGPQKDIKRAYAYYKKVCDEYPESAFWDEAADHASYIDRHYFDIR